MVDRRQVSERCVVTGFHFSMAFPYLAKAIFESLFKMRTISTRKVPFCWLFFRWQISFLFTNISICWARRGKQGGAALSWVSWDHIVEKKGKQLQKYFSIILAWPVWNESSISCVWYYLFCIKWSRWVVVALDFIRQRSTLFFHVNFIKSRVSMI